MPGRRRKHSWSCAGVVAAALVSATPSDAASVGPEFAMDAPVLTPVTSADLYEDVEVGYGAGTYLVTWLDAALPKPRQAVRVRASDGAVLDATPIALQGSGPAGVTSDGTSFLVAWGGGAARIAISSGALLDGTAGFVTPSQAPAVAYVSATGQYVEAWSTGTSVSQASINASSAVIGPTTPLASTGAGEVPTVAAATSGALVAWADQRSGTANWDIFGNLPTVSNFPLVHSLVAKSFPSAASNGADYFVTWTAAQLSGTRVRASDGTALDGTAGMPLSTGMASTGRASFDGTNYVVAYAASNAVHVVRVSPGDGSLLDGAPSSGGITVTSSVPSGTSPSPPVIASSGTESLVAWVAMGNNPAVMASRVRASDGAVLDGATGITLAPSRQHTTPGTPNSETVPVIASDGTNFLVSWSDDRVSPGAASSSYGMLVRSSDGALLAPSAFPLAIAPVALAFDGTNFFASGNSSSTRIRPTDRTELDLPNGIAASGQSVACLGGTCLVMESRFVARSSASYLTVFYQRVRASDGAPFDTAGGVQLSGASNLNSDNAYVVAGTNSFLVVWREEQFLEFALRYAIFDLAGVRLGPLTLASHATFFAVGGLASDGKNFFVIYSCDPPYGMVATRIRESDGALLDGVPGLGAISISPGRPAVATTFDGQNFLSVYGQASGLVGMRVRPSDGTLLDGPAAGGFPVTSTGGIPFALASAGRGRSMVGYSAAGRILARFIDEADGAFDAGAGLADGGVGPMADGGSDASLADGGVSHVGMDATTAYLDGGSDSQLSAMVDAAMTTDARLEGMDAAAAVLDATSSHPLGDGSSDGADASSQGSTPSGGGGSGGCSLVPGQSSNGAFPGGVFLLTASLARLLRARRMRGEGG